jgi:galactokinase
MPPQRFDRTRIDSLRAALDVAYGPTYVPGRPHGGPVARTSAGSIFAGTPAQSSPIEIVRAPAMVDLMGDQTDPNDGFVLAAAIDLETWIAFRRRRDGHVRMASRASRETASFWIDSLTPRRVGLDSNDPADSPSSASLGASAFSDHWSDHVAATAWSLREATLPIRGLDGFVDTTIPAGADFSSSAALELASAVALLGGGIATAPALAALAQRGERDYLGLDCGMVDHLVCAAGREGRAMTLDSRSLDVRYVPLPYGIRVVVCDTGLAPDNGKAIHEARRAECARAIALLAERIAGLSSLRDLDAALLRRHRALLPEKVARRAEHVTSENARVVATAAALEACDLDELGRLFAESHASLRDRYEAGSPAVEAMVDVATAIPGVVAARMIGSGLGGCTVNLVLADAVQVLEAAVSREYGRRTGLTGRVYAVEVVDGAGPVNPAAG